MTLTPMIFQQDPEAGGVCPKIVGQLLAVVPTKRPARQNWDTPSGSAPVSRARRPLPPRDRRERILRLMDRASIDGRTGLEKPERHARRRVHHQFCPARPHCRSGFSRDPCVIENQGFRVTEADFTATPTPSKTRVRGESPSYRKPSFCRSGFRRDPLRHREPGVRGFEAAFTANLAPSKAEVRGSSSPMIGDRVEGNGPRLPCLDPRARWEGQGGRCPAPIIAGS
jgi:hypothetical protein